MSILLIEKKENILQAAVINRNALYAYSSTMRSSCILEGQIYLGIVGRALKSISAVFVNLDNSNSGFLPLRPEQKVPASGTRVIVQVKRPPIGDKKALLSMEISLPSEHLVLLPFSTGIHISSRIQGIALREELYSLGHRLKCENSGIILRSSSIGKSIDDLDNTLQVLQEEWSKIQTTARRTSAPALLWDGDDPVTKLLSEESGRLERIITNSQEYIDADLPVPAQYCAQPFHLFNVEDKLNRSLRRSYRMKSGATLVIDPCEAMTVIDVNSALASGGQDIEKTAARVDKEAAWEIARLLRLRQIGGMVLIDFIDSASESVRDMLINEMKTALSEDPVKTTVHDFTQLGIMEITRHRKDIPYEALPDIPCPCCGGTGISFDSDVEVMNNV